MNRSSQHQSVILRVVASRDSHGVVDLLTADRGLVRAMAYGMRSPRSALRGMVVPFARGTVWLYTDPRQDLAKITDMTVHRYSHRLREDLVLYSHATLWAETIWRTMASGEPESGAYPLLLEGLDLLDALPRKDPSRGDSQGAAAVHGVAAAHGAAVASMILLWRYLEILGVQPDISSLTGSLPPGEVLAFDPRDSALLLCEHPSSGSVEVVPGVIRLLRASESRSLEEVAGLPVTPATRESLRRFVLTALREAAQGVLNTLEVAGSWL